ncbi:PQQ-binding-like beta-propeller repeat protein [Streptomyces sp. NPDC052682]|uniref:outer membrane protein assembly factor BamB family protein n=1 Tax=Streptomyces sp. NPDC052682 TaxID=3154954 RepID=UPI00341259A2
MAAFGELTAGDPGRVGRYRIVARLGAGGMGQVYLGRSPGGRAVAVKVVRPELAGDPEFRRRFAREVAAARRVNGVFTAGVVDADIDGSPPWLATAYVPGVSLGEAVSAYGRWAAAPVVALGAALAEALEVIHAAGVVHRDLKPSNVLLAVDGPRVIDFGISVVGGASALTGTGMVVGTPGFMAPEQVVGGPVGPACDVFALGAVLAYTATGTAPFGTGPAHAVNFRAVYEKPGLEAVPSGLRDLVESCLAKEAAERPELPALLEQLTRLAGDDPPTARSLAGTDWLPTPVARELSTRPALPVPTPVSPQTSAAAVTPASRPEVPIEDRTASGPPGSTATVALRPAAGTAATPSGPPLASLPSRRHVLLGLAGTTAAAGVSWAAAALAEHYYTGRTVPTDARTEATTMWSLDLRSPITAPPVLADGLLYVTTRESVTAADAAGGSHRWKTDTTASRTAVARGRAYLVNGAYVRALNAATGRNSWLFHADTELNGWLSVVDGVAYTGGKEAAYAIDAASGKQRWTLPLRRAMSWDPVVADGVAYLVGGGTVYAVDAATGERRWTFEVGDDVSARPRLADGVLYVGHDSDSGGANTLYAVDTATGEPRWQTDLGDWVRTLAVAGGRVFAGVTGKSLYALDAATGARRWSFRTGSYDYMAPVIADGVVYVGSEGNRLNALDAATGERRWTFSAGDTVRADPTVTGGVVYAVGQGGTLSAVDAATGSFLWNFATGAQADYAPVVTDDMLYLSSGPNLHALAV